MRDKPGIPIGGAPGIDFFEEVQRGVMLVKLHGELRVECGETVRCLGLFSFGPKRRVSKVYDVNGPR